MVSLSCFLKKVLICLFPILLEILYLYHNYSSKKENELDYVHFELLEYFAANLVLLLGQLKKDNKT